MAVIPGYVAGQGLDTAPQTRPSTRVDDSAARARGQAGAALGQMGGAVSGVGRQVGDMALRLERQQLEMQAFRTEQEWQRLNLQQSTEFEEDAGNIDPSGDGFAAGVLTKFDAKAQEFLPKVPEHMREKFQEIIATKREAWLGKAAAQERLTRQDWYRTGIEERTTELSKQVFDNPDVLEGAKEEGLRVIEASGLPPAEKAEMSKKWLEIAETAALQRMVETDAVGSARVLDAAVRLPGLTGVKRTVADAAADEGVDPRLALAIVQIESGFKADAKNPNSSASGLFQFISSTGKRYGVSRGASVEQQARGGAKLTADNIKTLRASLGREPSAGEVYLAHFLGVGGARVIGAMGSGTKLDAALARFGDATAIMDANPFMRKMSTVGDLKAWADGKMTSAMKAVGVSAEGFGGRGSRSTDPEIPAEIGALMERFPNVSLKNLISLRDKAVNDSKGVQADLVAAINDDITSLEHTGQGLEIDPEQVEKALGEDKLVEWQEKRGAALALFHALDGFEELPQAEIIQRVDELKPQPGAEGFAGAQNAYEKAQTKAKKVIDDRAKDPAAAVNALPEVREAYAGADPRDMAGSMRAIVDARLAAQERIGIPEFARAPITKQEARSLGAAVKNIPPDQFRQALEAFVTGLDEVYGEHAPAVLQQVVAAAVKDEEKALYATRILNNIIQDRAVPPIEARKVDETDETIAIEAAGGSFTDRLLGYADAFAERIIERETTPSAVDRLFGAGEATAGPQTKPQPEEKPAKGKQPIEEVLTGPEIMDGVRRSAERALNPQSLLQPTPSERALQFLKDNPDTLPQFIELYGQNQVPEGMRNGR